MRTGGGLARDVLWVWQESAHLESLGMDLGLRVEGAPVMADAGPRKPEASFAEVMADDGVTAREGGGSGDETPVGTDQPGPAPVKPIAVSPQPAAGTAGSKSEVRRPIALAPQTAPPGEAKSAPVVAAAKGHGKKDEAPVDVAAVPVVVAADVAPPIAVVAPPVVTPSLAVNVKDAEGPVIAPGVVKSEKGSVKKISSEVTATGAAVEVDVVGTSPGVADPVIDRAAGIVAVAGSALERSPVSTPAHTVHSMAAAPEPLASGATDGVKTFVSTPRVLEIGMADGTHGWLRVRAEMGGDGQVQAQFTAASAGAAAELHKVLPGMQAYLASEQVGVRSIVVSAADRSAGAGDVSAGHGGDGARRESSGDRPENLAALMPVSEFGSDAGGAGLPAALFSGSAMSGGWLSVRV